MDTALPNHTNSSFIQTLHITWNIFPGEVPIRKSLFYNFKSKSHYSWRSASHVKVSSPFWDLWPDITFCRKIVFWNLLSCLSLWREVGSVICLSLSSNLPLFTSNICVTCVLQFSNLYTINIKLQLVPSEYSRLCSASYFSSNILQESKCLNGCMDGCCQV
jgi:hypothetical protein